MRAHLSPQNLDDYLTVPNGRKRIEIADLSGPPGFFLEVRATSPGEGTYWCRYRRKRDNRMMYVKISRTTELSLAAARKRAEQIRGEVACGRDPRGEELAKKEVMTFEEFMTQHYFPYARARKKSIRRDEGIWRLYVRDALGKKRITDLTRHDVQRQQTLVVERGLSSASGNHVVRLVRGSLGLAVLWGMLERNVAARIPMLHEAPRERYLTDEELDRFVYILKTDRVNPHVCQVILALMGTGLRLQEALSSTWRDVDLDRRVWIVPGIRSKNRKTRSVPINDATFEVLNGLSTKGTEGHLFVSPRTGKRFTTISKQFTRLTKASGIEGFRIHDCRHFFASALVSSGKTLYETQQLLGHCSPVVTMRYAHLSAKALEGAAAAASAKLNGAAPKSAA